MILRCVHSLKNRRCTTDIPVRILSEIFWILCGFCIMCIFLMMCAYSTRNGIEKFFYKNRLPIKYIGWINI